MQENVITILYLCLNSINDLKKKQIVLWSVVLYFFVGIFKFAGGGVCAENILMAVICFALFGGGSILTGGSLGFGDVLIITSLPIVLEVQCVIITVGLGFLAAFVYSVVYFVIENVNKNLEIPFIPFLFLGYIGGMLLN